MTAKAAVRTMGRHGPGTYLSLAREAIARWRVAHRHLDDAAAQSPEWRQALVAGELARADYQQAIAEARRERLYVPPPFEDATTVDWLDVSNDEFA